MISIAHARASIEAQLAAYRAEHGAVTVEQVDVGLEEDGRGVYFLAHLSDGSGLAASVRLDAPANPATFDRDAWREAFDEQLSVLRH